jgi:hypothetical protein
MDGTRAGKANNVREWVKRKESKKLQKINLHLPLNIAVQMWPTPTAHNAKECAAPSEGQRNTPTLAYQAGGKLNPPWVEWLMGFPIGWTDLGAWVTPLSRKSRKSSGER